MDYCTLLFELKLSVFKLHQFISVVLCVQTDT